MQQLDLSSRLVRAAAGASVLGLLACNTIATELGGDRAVSGGNQVAVSAPSITLSVAPQLIVLGQSALITWDATGATDCQGTVSPAGSGGAWGGDLPVSNAAGVSVTPTERGAITYTLTCNGPGGSSSASDQLAVDSPPPPTIALSASPLTASVGDAILFTWAATNADSCVAGGAWTGNKALSGAESVIAASPGAILYTLACAGPLKTVIDSVTVTVTGSTAPPPPPPTASLTANPLTASVGDAILLTWTSSNATSCLAGGAWSGAKALSGSESVTAVSAGTLSYILSCSGAVNTASDTVLVTVTTAPPTNAAPVSRPTVSCSGMTCTFDGRASSDDKGIVKYVWWNSSVTTPLNTAAFFTRNFVTSYPRIWKLTVWDLEGLSHTDSVQFTPAPITAPPTATLTANPLTAPVGSAVLLTWTSSNAISCVASGAWTGSKALSGSESVVAASAGAISYILSCSGPVSTASDTVTVTVTAPPPANAAPVSRPTVSCSGMTCTFDGRASSDDKGIVKYVWWDGVVTAPINTTALFTVTFTGAHPRTWRLTVWDLEGLSDVDSVQFTVPAPTTSSPTASLTASPLTAPVGSTVLLTWTSSNATSCVASGAWTGSKALSGSQSVVLATAGANSYTITCAGTLQSATASVSVTGLVASVFTAQFTPNAVTIATSEGAPYIDADFWTGQTEPLSAYGYGPTKVIRLYICLSGMVSRTSCSDSPPPTGPLSSAMLNGISAGIAAYRNTGVRLLVRFMYNFGPIGPEAADVPASLVVTHIDQLAPILLQHRDLIFALQAGFIGVWGEWHNSTSGNDTPAARKLVLDREAFYFRGVFPIQLRYPSDLLTYLNSQTPSPDFGLHDDYYASDAWDGGTWSPRDGWSENTLKSYAAAVGSASTFVGEFGGLYPTLQSCSALDSYSYSFRPQSFALTIWPVTVGSLLQSQGCALSFFNKVGTRIEARSLTLSGNATAGGILHLSLTLANTGFGRVIRARPVSVVLSTNGSVLQRTQISLSQLDLRLLAASPQPAARTFAFDVPLPATLPSQPVSLSLLIPDPAPSLTASPAYALPLNSLDQGGQPVFDPNTGYNQLATILSGGIITASLARTVVLALLEHR